MEVPYLRERYENWIRDFLEKRYPDLVPRVRTALDTFESVMESGVLEREQLVVISECVRSRARPLSENIANLLGELALKYPQARQLVKELARDPKQHVRVSALIALSANVSRELLDDVLRAALRDRSPKLRLLAADKIVQFRLTDLLSDLEQAAAREQEQETREGLECQRDLLCRGFCARSQDDGYTWLMCRLPDGSLKSKLVSRVDVESQGLEAIARSLGADL